MINLYEEAPSWMFEIEVHEELPRETLIKEIFEMKALLAEIHENKLFADSNKISNKLFSGSTNIRKEVQRTKEKICNLEFILEQMEHILEREFS